MDINLWLFGLLLLSRYEWRYLLATELLALDPPLPLELVTDAVEDDRPTELTSRGRKGRREEEEFCLLMFYLPFAFF